MSELSYPEKRKLLAQLLEKKKRTRKSAPLSFAQERLYFLDQLQPNSSLYNLPVSFRLQTSLNVDWLEKSLSEIVRRHEILRTTFEMVEGSPVQVVHPAAPVKLHIHDVSRSPDGETEALRQAASEAQDPFNLREGPLFRARLVRLHEQDHVLLLTMHHIVSDGWSMLVLMQELNALYESYSRGAAASLPELPIQYSDFALWQRQALSAEVIEKHLDYWREQLAGAPPILELPFDRPRPSVQSYRGAMETFTVGRGISNQLLRIGKQEGTTVFMTLLAAFQVLLARYSGQWDVVVGTPIANRDRAELEGLIGFFVNTLVLRTKMEDDPSFVELLRRVRQTTVDAYAHQDLPFEKLVEELHPERELSHNPLFQVIFATDLRTDAMRPSSRAVGSSNQLAQTNTGTSKFDLAFNMSESQAGLAGIVEFNTDLFDAATIQRLIGIWKVLLEAIVANPDERVSKLKILPEQERRQQMAEWNGAASPSEPLVHMAIAAQAQRTPEAVAIKLGENVLTYRELERRAGQVARGLGSAGMLQETPVAVCMNRSFDAVVALLGTLKTGCAYLPLNPLSPDEVLKTYLQDSGATVVLTQRAFENRVRSWGAQPFCIESFAAGEISEDDPGAVAIHPQQMAYVTYDSGSVGAPIGIAVSQQSLASHCHDFIRRSELGHTDHVLQLSGFVEVASLEQILPALMVGSRLLMRGDTVWPAEEVHKVLVSESISLMNVPTAYWRELCRHYADFPELLEGHRLRLILVDGDPTLLDGLRLWRQGLFKQTRILAKYGSAEALTTALFEIEHNVEGKQIPLGRPAGNCSLYVLDTHLNPVPVGVAGELFVGGNRLARGYLNRASLTAARFLPDPYSQRVGARMYRTGDLARYLPDRVVEFIGSVDRQVRIRGMRLDLGKVEAVLREFPGVQDAVTATYQVSPGDVRLGAYLAAEVHSRPTQKALRRYLGGRLPAYMRPSVLVWLDRLPMNSSGNIDRNALPPFPAMEAEPDFVAPASAIEKVMAGIWAELIGVEMVGGDDSFFELGGHSLLATQLCSRIFDIFDIMIPLQQLFEEPTLADFCSAVLNASSDRHRTERIAELMLIVAAVPDAELPGTPQGDAYDGNTG
jgi:amino acid adenylation domain-containing protein